MWRLKIIQTAALRLVGRIREALEQFYSPREIAAVGWFLLAGIMVLGYRVFSDPSAPLLDRANVDRETRRSDSIFNALSDQQASESDLDTMPRHFSLVREPGEHTPVSDPNRPLSTKRLPSPRSISLNSATHAELEQLPGIGPTMAERIISYRTERGRFRAVEELTNVHGIGAKKFEKVSAYLTLD
jgi:comEA protein